MLKKMSTLFNSNVRGRTARSFLPSVAAVAVGAAIVAILVACSSDPPPDTSRGPMATLSAAETAGTSGSIVNLTFTDLDKQIAKYWWVIVPDGDDPTEAQVRAGQDAAGTAADNAGNSDGGDAIAAPTAAAPNPTLLLQVRPPRLVNGSYEVFIVVEDADENSTLLKASFTANNPGAGCHLRRHRGRRYFWV